MTQCTLVYSDINLTSMKQQVFLIIVRSLRVIFEYWSREVSIKLLLKFLQLILVVKRPLNKKL